MRRQQVGSIVARVVECLDPGLERLALLVFGYKRQFALCVGWDGHGYLGEIQGGADTIQPLILTRDVDDPVAAIKVSDLDGRHGIEGWPRRVVAESHAGGAWESFAGMGRHVDKQE